MTLLILLFIVINLLILVLEVKGIFASLEDRQHKLSLILSIYISFIVGFVIRGWL